MTAGPAASGGPGPCGRELSRRIRTAREAGPATARLLNVAAVLAPGPFPRPILAREMDESLDRLLELGLLRCGDPDRADSAGGGTSARDHPDGRSGPGVYMSEEVQAVLLAELPRPVLSGAVETGLDLLQEACDAVEGTSSRSLIPHALSLAGRLEELDRAPDRPLRLGAFLVAGAASQDVDGELLRASERLEDAAAGAPLLRDPFLLAALRDQRSGLLAAAGRGTEASSMAEAAVDHAAGELSPSDPRRALLHYNAAGVYKSLGRPGPAIEHLERARELLDDHAPPEGGLHPRVLLDLAECLLMAERKGEAAESARAAVVACRERFGPEHPDTRAAEAAARSAGGPRDDPLSRSVNGGP